MMEDKKWDDMREKVKETLKNDLNLPFREPPQEYFLLRENILQGIDKYNILEASSVLACLLDCHFTVLEAFIRMNKPNKQQAKEFIYACQLRLNHSLDVLGKNILETLE